MRKLPKIMVAPNGARKQKSDHPALPITHEDILATAQACFEAGAGGIHLHVRDEDGGHLLDANAYKALTTELIQKYPEKYIQVSTELAGVYTAQEQFKLLQSLKPLAASLALAEVESAKDVDFTKAVYQFVAEAHIDIQHIIYSADELERFIALHKNGTIKCAHPKLLFVLGRYTSGQQSEPKDLDPFLDALSKFQLNADWALCAFGMRETDCLIYGRQKGGKMRIGFENSIWNADGSKALSNHERVAEVFEE